MLSIEKLNGKIERQQMKMICENKFKMLFKN